MAYKYKSYLDKVLKDMDKAEKKNLKKAASHVAKKLRQKLKVTAGRSLPGQPPGKVSGELIKGVRYKVINRDSALVGFGPPAYHAHLMEFGTRIRKTKKGVNKGHVLPRPALIPVFNEEAKNVINIMSEPWL